MDYSLKICGEAGQGIQTIGDTLAHLFARCGYHVFTHQDYESRIRGGHNFYQIRFSDRPVTASRDVIDILVALDKDGIRLHENELSENGKIIYDSAGPALSVSDKTVLKDRLTGGRLLDVPFADLAVKNGGSKIMANTVATGAVLGILGMDPQVLFDSIGVAFKKKGGDIVEGNVNAAKAGYEHAAAHCGGCSFSLAPASTAKMLISGIEAIALGALASGCRFYSAYPMTPSTGIMNYIAGKAAEFNVVVEQAEDEVAAINMALGASFAGVRSMTGTSGGGFALMVEGLSLAAMTETPVVIALGQRPAPATGLPTRTEQGDLQFALYTAHGEFPRVIFAPGSAEEAFRLTVRAFDIAEKCQITAMILFDQYLADSQWTSEGFDVEGVRYADHRLRGEAFRGLSGYKRHAFTESGVSPLGIPGDAHHVVVTDSDEHDEEGHIIEDAETRIKMVRKRLFKKMPLIKQEMEPPVRYGDDDPEIVLAGWGSTYGVMREAVDALSGSKNDPRTSSSVTGGKGGSSGKRIAMLHFGDMYPFPLTEKYDYMRLLKNAELAVCIENNATGQFARLMRAETGFEFHARINRYDGRPFTVESLLKEIVDCLEDHLKRRQR